MTNLRITQVAIRADVLNDFVLIDANVLPFELDFYNRRVYKIREYELATVEENYPLSHKHYQLGKRGDYIIQDATGNLTIWTEEEYKKL